MKQTHFKKLILLALTGIIWPIASPFSSAADEAAGMDFFEKNIRPVLVENCYKCHSSEAKKVKGGLKLDTRAVTLKGGDSGPAIIPGDPENSLMVKALRYTGEELRMPPDGKLPDEVVNHFVEWIKMGAPDPRGEDTPRPADASTTATLPKKTINYEEGRKFWSFRPPADHAPPQVKNAAWPANPLDQFILAKLEEKNLAPAPEAGKRTLIRRATFDLTGLPPTPDEIHAFLADHSPDAFAKVVDRLLASPQYGERWGRHWLDVVRYTDSVDSRATYEQDVSEAYRYRDWVVDAFNRDMPYGKFLMMQIAGDLMPPEKGEAGAGGEGFNREGLIATGMLAIGNWPGGDADKQKMVSDIVDDQLDVVTRGMMGVTVACSRCHDHKFDPFATEDYYGLAGIFFSSHILPGPGRKTEGSPLLHIPLLPAAELEARKKRETRMSDLRVQIQAIFNAENAEAAKRLLPHAAEYMVAAWDFRNASRSKFDLQIEPFAKDRGLDPAMLRRWISHLGLEDLRLFKKPMVKVGNIEGVNGFVGEPGYPSLTVNANDVEVAYLSIRQPAKSVAVHPSPNAPVAVGWRSPISGPVRVSGFVLDADPNCGDGVAWAVELRRAADTAKLFEADLPTGGSQSFGDAVKARGIADPFARVEVGAGEMLQLVILPKADYGCDTTMIEFKIEEIEGEHRVWDLTKDLLPDLFASGQGNPHADSLGNPAVWHFIDMAERNATGGTNESPVLIRWKNEIGKIALSKNSAPDRNADAAREQIANAAIEVQRALIAAGASPAAADPKTDDLNARSYQELVSVNGPFWRELKGEELRPENREKVGALAMELQDLEAIPAPPIDLAVGIQEGGVPDTEHAGIHDVAVHVRGRYDRLGDVVPRRFPKVIAGENQPPITEGSGRLQLARFVASKENPLTARVMINRIWQHHFGEGIVRTPGNFGKLGEAPTHPELLDWLSLRFMESGWSIKAMHRMMMLSSTYRQASHSDDPAFAETIKADPENRLFGRANRRRLESEAIRDALLAVSGKLDKTLGGPAVRELNSPRRTLYLRTVRSDRATFGALFDAADPAAIVDRRTEATVAPQALFLMNNPFAVEQTKVLAKLMIGGAKPQLGEIESLYELLYGRPPTLKELDIGLRMLSEGRATEGTNETSWEQYCQVLLCANEFLYVD